MSLSEDRVWFYYAKETQVGPLLEAEMLAVVESGQLGLNDYVYREGFADWKSLKDVAELHEDRARAAARKTVAAPVPQGGEHPQRKGDRVAIRERVVAHNDAHVATGHISNISVTGVFFETADAVFALHDEIKLTLKEGHGLGKPMHLRGIIVRQCGDSGLPLGYGMELRGLDEAARARIVDYIKRHEAA